MSRAGYLVVTPGVTGTDGIALVSRLVVRALEPPSAGTAAPVDVLSVGDAAGPARMTGALGRVALSGADGRKLRFIGLALRRALAGPRPSDVLCLHLRLSPVARLVTGARGRLAVFLHGIEAWKPLGPLERWALGRADVLVANSEHTARGFRRANPGFSCRPIAVCHLGVGAAHAIQSSDSRARDAAGPFALIVGRLAGSERYKGHDVLIDLWPRIRDAVPDARLVVAGDGDDRARLEAKAAALGPPVRFLGRVSDPALDALYRDCTFFVMPSRDEGFGLVFLEAMRAGKACIGGAGAAAEVIEDGVTGLVVDATDEAEVEKAVVRLFLEPETRSRMGRAGAERVAREFTEAHFRRRLRAILGLHTP
jgi:phosphatidylinositol alpha-1,6-mannosyltransferase